MPITITPNNPGGLLGPGVQLKLQSDFIGPLPSGSFWVVDFSITGGTELPFWHVLATTNANPIATRVMTPLSDQTSSFEAGQVPIEGGQVAVHATLSDGTNIVDSTTTPFPWSTTQGLGEQMLITNQTGGQGLTAEQSLQLSETHAAVFPEISIDSTLKVSSGLRPPGDLVEATMPVPIFGLIIRIHEFGDMLPTQTPDGVYFFPDLAVVSIFRGPDLWMRVPIHTPSKVVSLFSDVITAALATVTAATWLVDMNYAVAFRSGVVGEVIEMRFP